MLALDESEIKNLSYEMSKEGFTHSKVLCCQQPLAICPAPVQIIVVRDPDRAHKIAELIPSWSSPRVFRPLSEKNGQVLNGFGVIAFNFQPVARQPDIDFDVLVDRRLLAEAISGITERTNFPLTIYSAHVRHDKEISWFPIEGTSSRTDLLPRCFNLFCELCRDSTVVPLSKSFENKVLPKECPLSVAEKCKQRFGIESEPCRKWDWSRCYAFEDATKNLNLCRKSDFEAITTIKLNAGVKSYRSNCWGGFVEMIVPIIVHDHLVAVAMTGQFLVDSTELISIEQLMKKNIEFTTKKESFQQIIELLKGDRPARYAEEARTKAFVLNNKALESIEQDLAQDVVLIEEIANQRYKSFRSMLEASFRQELIWRLCDKIKTGCKARDVFELILRRMAEFWGFKHGVLLGVTNEGRTITHVASHISGEQIKTKDHYSKYPFIVQIDMVRKHPLVWVWESGNTETIRDQWLASVFKRILGDSSNRSFPDSKNMLMVVVPQLSEAFIFLLVDRDDNCRSRLKRRGEKSVSLLCQESIIETCSTIIERWTESKQNKTK